jgi:hypothetical protein
MLTHNLAVFGVRKVGGKVVGRPVLSTGMNEKIKCLDKIFCFSHKIGIIENRGYDVYLRNR